ncbi:MAG: YraN family protein [Lachnospiraceae bacterium]
MNKREKGSHYEQIAAACLIRQGYEILEQNYRGRHGEIDLIARESGYLVFIEVKYRKDGRFGDPAEAVDRKKQGRIRQAARCYLFQNGYGEEEPCRFDVVSILGEEITVLQNAF